MSQFGSEITMVSQQQLRSGSMIFLCEGGGATLLIRAVGITTSQQRTLAESS